LVARLTPRGAPTRATRLTRAPVDLALSRCSVRQVIGGSRLAGQTRTDGLSTNCAAPPADTRRVVCLHALRRVGGHVLARSIQFSKNRNSFPLSGLVRREGNLTILLSAFQLVKPLRATPPAAQGLFPLLFLSLRRPRPANAKATSARRVACESCRAWKARRCPADRAEPTHYTDPGRWLSTSAAKPQSP
jgi:hypothetical protein